MIWLILSSIRVVSFLHELLLLIMCLVYPSAHTRFSAWRHLGHFFECKVRWGSPLALGSAFVLMQACGGGANEAPPRAPASNSFYSDNDGARLNGTVNGNGGPIQAADKTGLEGTAKASYERGYSAWFSQDLHAAKQAFQTTVQQAPSNAAAFYSLGVVDERLGDISAAESDFRSAMTIKPDYEAALGAFAFLLASSGRLKEADTFLSDKRNRMPGSARLATYLAEIKSLEQDHDAAQQLAQDALRINPDLKEAMVTIARDHYRARKIELARYALQAILDGFGQDTPARDANNAEANLLRGLIEREFGRRQIAMKAFENAVRKRGDLSEALIHLGSMKLETGNTAEALSTLESAVRYAPTNAVAHLNLGDCYRLVGRVMEAKREFDAALTLDPHLAATHYDLGLLFLFAPNIPGMSASSQIENAIAEFGKYKEALVATSSPHEDVDELMSGARAKQGELNSNSASTQQKPQVDTAAKNGQTPK